MLSAIIGLIVDGWLARADAEARAGLAQSATATPNEVTTLETPPSID